MTEETIRSIVRQEVENVVRTHLCSLTAAVLEPLVIATCHVQQSAKQLIDGQALIEKHLAGAFNDDEPWRESFNDGD